MTLYGVVAVFLSNHPRRIDVLVGLATAICWDVTITGDSRAERHKVLSIVPNENDTDLLTDEHTDDDPFIR